jgi:hypothetical protein
MESIIHESFVIGCDQDECKKENNDKGIGRPADNDTAAGACASDLLTATAILSDFGDEYSEYGDASTVRDGNIELLVIKLSARHAKTQLDKRPTDVKLPNGDGSPNNWDACSNCGACQAGVAMPNNEEDTNEVDGILSVLGVQAKSDMNCCSGSKTAFLRHLQTANVTETVDVLSRSSSVDSKVTTDVVGRSCLTEVIKGTVSSPEVQKNIIAEVKMATMLFAVTVVFALTFLPGSAMIFKLIPYNKSVFNMYFFNFVANPIIYSFMSNSFRKQLKGLFNKRRQH